MIADRCPDLVVTRSGKSSATVLVQDNRRLDSQPPQPSTSHPSQPPFVQNSSSSTTMHAFVINEYAHPSQIRLTTDAPEPRPSRNEVVVEVYSAGLNFFDVGSGLFYIKLLSANSM